MENKFYRYQAFPFFLTVLSFYLLMIIYLDNTNITTTNGLYKAIDTNSWEKGTRLAVDSGGLLYAFSMGMISKFIPDSLVSFYGEVTNFVAYRKLAWINSFFGAASCTVVLSLAYSVTRDKLWALGVALVHVFSAFILINSIISEDIIPGYFFFTLSFLFLFKALEGNHVRLFLAGSTLSATAMMFLHWSLLPPLAACYFCLVCFLGYHDRQYVRQFIEQLIFFVTIVFIFVCAANFVGGSHFKTKLSVLSVFYPNKADSSWVGFGWHKIECLYLGVGNYLLGGKNITSFSLSDLANTARTIISWIITLSSIFCLLVVFFKEQRKNIQVLSIFGLSIFFFGECQNLYGQPQDPQFQVQPMFLIPVSLICFYLYYPKITQCIKTVLFIFALLIGIDNLIMLKPMRSGDSKMVIGYHQFREYFPKQGIKIVHLGYEEWSAWLMLFDYQGDFKTYLSEVSCLNTPFHFLPGISVEEASKQTIKDIDEAIKAGKRIIVTTPWIHPDYICELRAQNLTKEQITKLKEILLQNYQVKATYKLKWGEFAEIEKRKS